MARVLNEAGFAIIKKWEGLRLKAYLCSAGVPTIGYGHTSGVRLGMTCTRDQAEAWIVEDVRSACALVESRIRVPLNDNQFAALVSLAFNLPKAFGPESASTLRRLLNTGDYASVPGQIVRWNKVTDPKTGTKRVEEGLVNRRAEEVELWNTPVAA